MNTKYFHHTRLPSPFPYAFPAPTGTYPWKGAILPSCPSFKKKKENFLVYGSYTGVFVVTFPYIHVLYAELVYPFHYSPFYPSPLLMVTSTGFDVPYSYMYRKYMVYIHPLYFLPLLSLSY
jgi:hypothetical protein